ncbi:hypothetical protein ACX80E_15315 [Arthrobacter sp. TMN-49]
MKELAGSALEQMAQAVTEGFGKMVAWLGTFWVDVDVPPLITANGGASTEVAFIQSNLWYWTLSLAIFGVLIGAGRMIYERRGEPLQQIVVGLVRFILVASGAVTAIQLLIVASDSLAKSLIDNSTNGTGFGTNLLLMMPLTGSSGVFLVILLGVTALVTSLLQLGIMIGRVGALVLLSGLFPTAASFTNTEAGKQWFQRFVGWTLAFIAYKPVAALIYATAFKLTGSDVLGGDKESGVKLLTGLGLMVLALVALPALMRFAAPMVGAVAGGGGGGAAMGAMAGSLASGAISKGLGGGGGGGRSGGHSSSKTSNNSASKTTKDASGAKSGPSGGKSSQVGPQNSGNGAKTGASAGAGNGAGAGSGAASGRRAAGAAAGASKGAGAAAGGAASGGAAAAGGPAGMAVAAGAKAVKAGADVAKGVAESATGEGPSGSKG